MFSFLFVFSGLILNQCARTNKTDAKLEIVGRSRSECTRRKCDSSVQSPLSRTQQVRSCTAITVVSLQIYYRKKQCACRDPSRTKSRRILLPKSQSVFLENVSLFSFSVFLELNIYFKKGGKILPLKKDKLFVQAYRSCSNRPTAETRQSAHPTSAAFVRP